MSARRRDPGRLLLGRADVSAWEARQKHPRVLRERGDRICSDGAPVSECEYDHSLCRDCEREFEDCACYLDSERVEWMRSQMRAVPDTLP